MSFGNSGDFDRNNPSSMRGTGRVYADDPMNPPPRKSNTLWWILGIIGALLILGALVCCGGGYYVVQFTTQVIADEVKNSIAGDPAIEEHIGTISKMDMNLTATGAAGGNNKLVFDVAGDKGAGQLEVSVTNEPGGQTVNSCVLVLPDGTRHDVVLAAPADEANIEAVEATDGEPIEPIEAVAPDSPPTKTTEVIPSEPEPAVN